MALQIATPISLIEQFAREDPVWLRAYAETLRAQSDDNLGDTPRANETPPRKRP